MTGPELWGVLAVVTPVLVAVNGALFGFIRMMVRSAIAESNAEQLKQINGTYVRAAGSTMTGMEIERALVNRVQEATFRRDLENALREDFKSRGGSPSTGK